MPDFVVRKLKNTYFIDLHVIGEVKGQDAENDTFVNLVYLMRIGLLSKDAINNNLHKGIIGIQAVGKCFFFSFLLITLLFSIYSISYVGLYTTVYVTSLVGGRDVSQMRAYTSLCEDLLYLTRLSKTCLEQVESPS
jgi:hypothetical protein